MKRVFNKKYTVLFVSSDLDERTIASERFNSSDCEVCTVSSFAEVRSTQPLIGENQLILISTVHPEAVEISNFLSASRLEAEFFFLFNKSSAEEEHPHAVHHSISCFGYTNLQSVKHACRLMQANGLWWEVKGKETSVHDRYRKILNRVHQGVVDTDDREKIIWANNTFKNITGSKDPVGRSLEEFVDPRDIPCISAVQVQLRSGIISPYLVRLRGSEEPVEIDSTPRLDKEGKYKGCVSLIRQAKNMPAEEFMASRNLSYLYSLALRLSRAFDVSKVTGIITESVKDMCGCVCCGIKINGYAEIIDRSADHSVPEDFKQHIDTFCSALGKQNIRVIKDAYNSKDPFASEIKQAGYRGIVCVALTVGTERIGCIWALSQNDTAFTRENNSFLISVGIQAGLALQNAMNVKHRLEEEANRRHFYRDALNALTSGKLVFCERDEVDSHWAECGTETASMDLKENADVPQSRRITEKAMTEQSFTKEQVFDMVTCVSEAATNAVKYGPPGKLAIKAEPDGIHIRIDDIGPGIAFANIPKAVLLSGFSMGSAPSLGLGYSVMLEMCDCVYLCTGDQGTTLILEMVHSKADPLDAFVGFTELADLI